VLGGWGARDLSTTLSQNPFSVLAYENEEEYSPYDLDVSIPRPSNTFLQSSMKKLGGGETRLLEKLHDYERRGGGIDDVWKSLHKLDKRPLTIMWQTSIADCVKWLGGSYGCLEPPTFNDSPFLMDQNLSANPGPTFCELGFKKKKESLCLAWDLAKKVWDKAEEGPVVGYLKPRYSIAGRSKVALKTSFQAKAEAGRKFGRSIWMADQHEPLIAGAFSAPALTYFHDNFNVVVNGFNKFSLDPTRIVEKLKPFNLFINADFSDFDDNLGPGQFTRAFDILRYMYGVERGSESVQDRLLDWLEDEISDSLVVTPTGKVVHTAQGMPSGTGLTAILDSLVNAAMWFEFISVKKLENSQIFIQGDDNLLGCHAPRDSQGRGAREWGERLLKKAALFFEHRFGAQLNPFKSVVGNLVEVGYAQPRVPEEIADKSSSAIAYYRSEMAKELGRKPNFSEKFVVLDREPIGPAPGLTHRWTYLFSGRVPFLSHYFKRDNSSPDERYLTVRPTAEVVSNLLYPEGSCKTLDDHIARLQSAVVENMGNHHVVNRVMHYYYDAWILKNAGLISAKDVKLAKFDKWLNTHRAWYRKVDRNVDLLLEDQQFAVAWHSFLDGARKAHQSVFGPAYTDWGRIRALRRGHQRYGLGLTLNRHITAADYSTTLHNPSVRESLGELGLGIWANPRLRDELGSSLITILEEPHFSRAAPQVVYFKTKLYRLRTQFSTFT
jgi:hypothetical protein